MTLEPGTRLGPYEVLGPLGAGGMGEVYRARDTRLDRLVAVKVLPADSSPQAIERFTRETKAIAALNHPGICAVYDVGTSPVPFLVMELLDGETLHQRLVRGPLDVQALIEIGVVLADALASAHAKGIVHRDLKPANIVLTPRGPKILDFGLARINDLDADVSSQPTMMAHAPLTDAGVAIGTLSYMSPEQLRGEPLDARTDLFSLGLVLYETATGRRAFPGTTSAMTSAAILHDQPAALRHLRPDVPALLEQAILTLLEKDREVRTQTAAELRAELTRLKRELGRGPRASDTDTSLAAAAEPVAASASRVSVAAPPPSSSDAQLVASLLRRHRGLAVGVAALVLLVVVGAAYFVVSRAGETDSASDAASLSIADLKVEVLTTSGTAGLPTISPDGNYVVYVENGGGRDSLRLRQVATGSNVELVPAEPGVFLLGATVTPDGAFVNYVKSAPPQAPELWQIPFLGGAARKLLPGAGGRVGFSPDGRQMAFVRTGKPGETELVVTAIDGASERVISTRRQPELFWPLAVRQSFAPAWSPDGKTLAVIGGNPREASGQVVFVDVQTGAQRAVAVTPNSAIPGTGLAWLDDDAVLASMFDRVSAPLQLWLLSYPDGKLRRLTNDTDQYIQPSVTADRSGVVVARNEASFGIWTSDAAAKAWTQTVPTTPVKGPIGFRVRWVGDDLSFMATASGGFALTRWRTSTRTSEILAQSSGNHSVSRDGSTIVFYDYDTAEHWKTDAAGRNRVRLSRGQGPSTGGRLSPDGRFVTYVGAAGPKGPAVIVQSMDDPSRTREAVVDGVRGAFGAAEVSPDGRSIAFPSFDSRRQPAMAVCDLDTCSSRRTLPALSTWRWMPDGQGLAYVDPRTQSDLWVQPLDGGAPRQLTQFPADGLQIWDFDWSGDGKRLAVARARISSDIVLFRGFRPPAR